MASTTVANYQSRIETTLGLDSSAYDSLMLAYLNEGYEDVLLRTRCHVESATVDFTANTFEYDLPTQPLKILTFQNSASGSLYDMEPATLQEIRSRRRASATASWPARYYNVTGDKLTVWPTPSTGESLIIDYVPRPTALSGASDTPSDIPAEYNQLLEWYALDKLAFIREHELSVAKAPPGYATIWGFMYDKGIREMRHNMKQGPAARLRVGRRRPVLNDRSVINW